MNAGFSNLTSLKAQLLAAALRPATDFDVLIQALGLGVAKSFARFCNRDFEYQAGVLEIAQGDRSFWYARHAPVTQFINVELRFFRSDSWTSIMGQPLQADEEKGLMHFGYTLGRTPIEFRLTYNGGYWWDITEDNTGVVPADITNNAAGIDPTKFLLPDDLRLAWILQCKHVWQTFDPLGEKIGGQSEKGARLIPQQTFADLDLIPQVKQMLQPYKRYQLT